MNTRVINDPSSLGWEYDPDTDRWTWGGGSSAGGGDGTFPEAPVDNKQYGRQNAGWTEIVHTDGGGGGYDDTEIKADLAQETQDRIDGDANLQGQIDSLSGNPVTTADVALVNPTRMPAGLENQQDANAYIAESLDKLIDQDGNVIAGGIEEAPQDSVIYGRRNKDWVVVPTSGGGDGGADLSAYYTAAQCDSKFEPKFIKNTAFNKNFGTTSTTVAQGNHTHSNYAGKNHNHDGVYQPAGSYAAQKHDHDGVYQPVGSYLTTETDPTVPSHVKSITQTDINKWNSSYDGSDAVKLTGAQTIAGRKTFSDRIETTAGQGAIIGGNIAGSGWITAAGNVTGYQFVIDGSRDSAVIGYGTAGQGQLIVAKGGTATLKASSGVFEVKGGGAALTGSLTATGTITGTDCIATSDERLKDNISTAPVGLIDKLHGREWDWTESGKTGSGVVAQELEEVLPHLVHTDDDGMKAVSYNGLIAYLIEEVKALKAEVETLRNG